MEQCILKLVHKGMCISVQLSELGTQKINNMTRLIELSRFEEKKTFFYCILQISTHPF